jgi:hypothetical protein
MSVNEMLMAASGVGGAQTFVEDVFSTFLYTGNATARSINNGIDLAGKGGLVWIKERDDFRNHFMYDSVRGAGNYIQSNTTAAQAATDLNTLSSFNSNGFSLGNDSNLRGVNRNPSLVCSWTFREQPKFFDIVTYTGNGTLGRTITHSLGSTPGMMIIKCTSNATLWAVYHTSLGNTQFLRLNGTQVAATDLYTWNNTSPTSSVFTVGDSESVNQSGYTYVAYLFAHNAGGFGLSGADNVISCGSFTTDGSSNMTAPVNLGYEPQYILYKCTGTAENWFMVDTMRGASVTSTNQLYPNLSDLEEPYSPIFPTATGFNARGSVLVPSKTYIYMAIRRPMKVPTTGTSVFSPNTFNSTTGTKVTTDFPIDLQMLYGRPSTSTPNLLDRLRGVSTNTTEVGVSLRPNNTNAETAVSGINSRGWDNTGFQVPSGWASYSSISWNFRRASGFMDVVCYTGTSANRTVAHNLTVVPELMIVKARNLAGEQWMIYHSTLGNTKYIQFTTDPAATSATRWNNTTPTSSVFTVGTDPAVNNSGSTYVAYLFATVAGVSKVGSYTGNGSNQTINCGFAAGARFILIKRTNLDGDWYVWDTARGIVTGNDPHLSLNDPVAEVTSDDSVDPASSGFIVNQLAATNINVNAATYIYLAIA